MFYTKCRFMQLKLVFLPMYFETENKLFILYCVRFRISLEIYRCGYI